MFYARQHHLDGQRRWRAPGDDIAAFLTEQDAIDYCSDQEGLWSIATEAPLGQSGLRITATIDLTSSGCDVTRKDDPKQERPFTTRNDEDKWQKATERLK